MRRQPVAAAVAAVTAAHAFPNCCTLQPFFCRQKDMQELFFTIYGVRTTSCNNVWLRNKLLQGTLGLGWQTRM